MIDLIGDVHGHADELEKLLQKLGYSNKNNYYSHPNPKRSVLFIGDYIDRGPKIRETLKIIKKMVDNNTAIALMGNHEYNALCFHQKDLDGNYLREHSEKNIRQHLQTLEQFENNKDELDMYLDWFKTLPLFYETDNFRAVHACWDYKSIDYLKNNLNNNRLNDDSIAQSVKKDTELYNAIEITLKGKELKLPKNIEFKDKDGNRRGEMRYKWWEDLSKHTYKTISMHPIENLPEATISTSFIENNIHYDKNDKCVFFGHYWLKVMNNSKNSPMLFRENICCLDYSIAKDGHLVAYSFENELQLREKNFTWVKTIH